MRGRSRRTMRTRSRSHRSSSRGSTISTATAASSAACGEPVDEPVEPEDVAVTAEARDLADARTGDPRGVTVLFARFRVREMNLDARQAHGLDGVEERERRVREGAAVQEQAVELASCLADA